MEFVDLSKPIEYNPQDPWFMRVKIKKQSHAKSKLMIRMLGLPFRLFPKGFTGWANDTITKLGVHSATHIDAPWHYAPECEGKPAKTSDQIPLDWCFGDGLVINMEHKPDFEEITVADIESFLSAENLEIKKGMIVLIRTGRDRYFGTPNFHTRGTGMSAEATGWLIDKGIKVMGIDSWGWDIPLPHQIKMAKKSNDSELFWKAHLIGKNKEYCHIEQMVNLDKLPYSGFKVSVFPIKLIGTSASPIRAVAMIDDKTNPVFVN